MKYPVFDAHCDTATELYLKKRRLLESDGPVSLTAGAALPHYAQVYAFCTYGGRTIPGFTEETLFTKPYAFFRNELAENKTLVSPCRTSAEIRAAWDGGKQAALLSLEGAEGISCDPGRLEQAKQLGITMVNLTWNGENALSGSCVSGGGLTRQGREFVKRAQSLGILIDVSHLSERGFWDLMDLTEAPVIASHSNSAALCPHARNLTDDQFQALSETGGVAGLNLYTPFLGSGDVTIDTACRHVLYFLERSETAVGLGGDLDGCDTLPEGFAGIRDYEKLENALRREGVPEKTLEAVFNGNFLRVL